MSIIAKSFPRIASGSVYPRSEPADRPLARPRTGGRRPPTHYANPPRAVDTFSIPWRPARRRDRRAAVCTSRPNLEDILISYGMSPT